MPTTKGLPGFLRRSLRVDYDDEEDDDNAEEQDQNRQVLETSTASGTSDKSQESSMSSPASPIVEQEDEQGVEDTQGTMRMTASENGIQTSDAAFTNDDSSTTSSTAAAAASEKTTAEAAKTSSPVRSSSLVNRTQKPKGKDLSDSWQEVPRTNVNPPIETKEKSYRELQFDKLMSQDVINMTELRKLAWNGIPSTHRADAWKILLGYLPTNQKRRQASLDRKRAEYRDAMAQHYDIHDDTRTLQEQETLRQVLVDVPRTAPEIPLFRNDRIRRILSRLLYIWAMRHPASSYVQGINDLATPLIVVFLADYFQGDEDVLDGHVMNHLSEERLHELEADVYWSLTNLLAGIQDHYTSDQPGVQRMVMRLQELVQRIDADLCEHFEKEGLLFLQFAFKWVNCLLLREFHLRCVIRLWDTYISERDGFEDFHVYVCAAFLCQFSTQLQEMNFDEIFGFMQDMPTAEWGTVEIEMLLSQAYVLSTLFGGSDAHLTSTNR